MRLTKDDLVELGVELDLAAVAASLRAGATLDVGGEKVELGGSVADFFATAVLMAASGTALLLAPEETLTPSQAAQVLGVSRPMVYRYIQQGLLEDRPVGGDHRITAASVEEYLSQRRTAAKRAMTAVAEGTPMAKVAMQRAEERVARRARPVSA